MKKRVGRDFSVRVLESLASLYIIQEIVVNMDLRQVLLRYVTSSDASAHRVIYHLVKHGLIQTPYDNSIVEAVDKKLSKLKTRKGPYVGYSIAEAVKSVLDQYNVIYKWEVTDKGKKYLEDKLRILGLDIGDIRGKSPLQAVRRIRRAFLQKYIASQRRGPSILDLYGGQMLKGEAVEVGSVDAAREFVSQALASIAPQEVGVEPKAGFAIAFARDEDAAAYDLINSKLWKDLNINHVNPLITTYRNYLISYAVSMLHPVSRRNLLEFIENSANWPRLAKQGRAGNAENYLEDAIRSGYILDRAGILYFQDPFIAHKEDPQSYIDYLNEIYFEGSIISTAGLDWRYESNIVKAVSSIAATIIWQSAYSYPLPIVRDSSGKILAEDWIKELKALSNNARGRILVFPKVIDEIGYSYAKKVVESYISPFVRKLIEGKVMHTIKVPEGGYEYLLPRGLSIKIFNAFRYKRIDNRVAQLVHSVKAMLGSAQGDRPFITKEVVIDSMRKIFGGKSRETISHLLREGVLIEIGGKYMLTPYDLPGVYLDLLKGSISIPHAQAFSANILRIIYEIPPNAKVRSDFIRLLSELEEKGRVHLRDYKDLFIVLPEAMQYLMNWITRFGKRDPRDPVIELLRDQDRFAARVLREALDWSPAMAQLTEEEAIKELREHIEHKDERELSESIERLGKEEKLYEPPYEKTGQSWNQPSHIIFYSSIS